MFENKQENTILDLDNNDIFGDSLEDELFNNDENEEGIGNSFTFEDDSSENDLESSFNFDDDNLNFNDTGDLDLSEDGFVDIDSLSDFSDIDDSISEENDTDLGFATFHNEESDTEYMSIDSNYEEEQSNEELDDIDDVGHSDFISDTGGIVVQDTNDDRENGFSVVYIDIENIAITQRIRKMRSVDALVQSIQSTGLLQPLVVAPTATQGLYVLLDGYRRIQACARAGKTKVPCIVNNRVNTPEIPILEAMYNHYQKYNIKEQIDYINYLETQKGIMNPTTIEYLLQMDSGDYTKLKDVLSDNDEDIVAKLYEGVYDIATAFKKLEQRRKKESAEEKENKKAASVYEDTEESGLDQIQGSGEEADGEALTDEQINALAINVDNLDEDVKDKSLDEMVEEDKQIEGFEPHKQEVGKREHIDPLIKKAVMARDNFTCKCCDRGGEEYVDILDYHHINPVALGGKDTVDNGIMLCVACHRLVHLYSTDDLHIDKTLLHGVWDEESFSILQEKAEEDGKELSDKKFIMTDEQKARYKNKEIFEDEQLRFKKIVTLGGTIRQGIAAKGLNKRQYKDEHPNDGIGRRKPGVKAPQEHT